MGIKRSESIYFRTDKRTYEKIQRQAKEAKMTISEYVGLTYDGGEILVFKELEELIPGLLNEGRNFNYLTKLCNMKKIKKLELNSMVNTLEKALCKTIHLKKIITKKQPGKVLIISNRNYFTRHLSMIGRNINQLVLLKENGSIQCDLLTKVQALVKEIWVSLEELDV